jgi:hypothetical protein
MQALPLRQEAMEIREVAERKMEKTINRIVDSIGTGT